MTKPDRGATRTYLGETSATDDDIDQALAAEAAAQARRCRVPAADADWPADLAEALMRRVAHNLALRALPLGLQASLAEGFVATNQVGGTDAEVKRLEAPYRKLVVG